MNKDIKSLLINTFGTISCLWVIFFFVTYILFSHNVVQDALKESWSASLTFLSVLATLGAAVIAAYLFNDWREQERVTFIRDTAHETANLIMQLMLSMQQYPQLSVSEIRVIHSKIVINLSFLNRQIKDDQMDKVNGNFSVFMKDFYNITISGIDNSTPPKQIKKEINENIESFTPEYTYISELVDINKVYKKVKASI